ncbi:hypothetical protein BC831DRAFT_509207 [Entophlyctis helioformis]|nr:hypothetical protein BC831DRAFT_509207 [Entophlyctis helioformis]
MMQQTHDDDNDDGVDIQAEISALRTPALSPSLARELQAIEAATAAHLAEVQSRFDRYEARVAAELAELTAMRRRLDASWDEHVDTHSRSHKPAKDAESESESDDDANNGEVDDSDDVGSQSTTPTLRSNRLSVSSRVSTTTSMMMGTAMTATTTVTTTAAADAVTAGWISESASTVGTDDLDDVSVSMSVSTATRARLGDDYSQSLRALFKYMESSAEAEAKWASFWSEQWTQSRNACLKAASVRRSIGMRSARDVLARADSAFGSGAGASSSSSTAALLANKNFDTERYAQMLEAEGFTKAQSQGLLSLVEEAISESLQTATKSLVSKEHQNDFLKESEGDFRRLRSEINLLEKKDFAVLKGELERIIAEVQRIKEAMQSDIGRVHGSVRLDVNLDKSRIKDEMADLNGLVTKCEEKIDREIEDLTSKMDRIRKSTRTSMLRFAVGCLTLFGVYKAVTIYAMPAAKKRKEVSGQSFE